MEIIGRLIAAFGLMGLASLLGGGLRACNISSSSESEPTLSQGVPCCQTLPADGHGVSAGLPDVSSMLSGDINERLPNGFTLEALDKMPEVGHIQKAGDSSIKVAWVGAVQVEGPFVLGRYDYTYFPKTKKEDDRNFFIFDTRSGSVRDYASEATLAASSGTSVHLTATPYFHAPRTSERISGALFLVVVVVPPIAWAISLVSKLRAYLKAASRSRAASAVL